jgi:eukaryotic-like serine/threonine-protein kinase
MPEAPNPDTPDDPRLQPTVVRSVPHIPPAGLTPVGSSTDHTEGTSGTVDAAGRYELGELIAQGGMGAVYAARDKVLNRRVAVKVLRPELEHPEAAARFRTEARITGQLQHPGVPPVHDLGTLPDGGPFLAMKLIKGRTLSDLLKDRPTPQTDLPRFVQAFEQICQTVAFAHSRSVIHRDLKPSNVMVGAFGEVQVMDWGLAKVLDGSAPDAKLDNEPTKIETHIEAGREPGSSDTHAGSVVGTPSYMPPEQAKGLPVDRRTDVFSLGAVLCEILTGVPPYTGTRTEVRAKSELGHVQEAFARLDASGADAELVALAKRCLAADPNERPADANEVAATVAAYRAGVEERLRAAEVARARAAEQRKRARVQLALALTVALLAGGAGAFAWWSDRQAEEKKLREAQHNAEQARLEAEQARSEAERIRVAGELKAARERTEAEGRARVPGLIALATELRKQFRFKEARDALDQANAVATASTPDLVPTVQQALRDLALVAKLDEIRLSKLSFTSGKYDSDASNIRFRDCFLEFGFDILKGDPGDLAKRIRESAVSASLLDALDQWGLDDSRGSVRKRIWDVTYRATKQEWRKDALDARDRLAAVEVMLAKIPRDEMTPSLHATLGFYQFLNGGDAVGTLRRGLLRYPDDFWHHAHLSLVTSFSPDRRMESLGHARAALVIRPNDPVLWFSLSISLNATGDRAGGAEALAIAQRLDPKFVQPTEKTIFDLLANTNPDEIIKVLSNLVEVNPKFAPGWGLLALTYLKKGDAKAAEAASTKALAIDPRGTAYIHLQVADLWLTKGDRAAAERCLRELVKRAPWAADAHAGLGVLLRYRDWHGALDAFQEATRLISTNGVTRAYFAEALAQCGYTGAEAEARAAINLAPNRPEPYCALGAAQYTTGKRAEALETFLAVTRVFPNHAEAQTWVCFVRMHAGDPAGGIVFGEEGVKLDPKHPILGVTLGQALVAAGNGTRGYAVMRAAVEAHPTNAYVHAEFGRALLENGRFSEALPVLKKGAELSRNLTKSPPLFNQLVAECERLIAVETRMTAVLAGKAQPVDATERLGFGHVCHNNLKRYTVAVRFYREAFESSPQATYPGTRNRYIAARAALLAATGQGVDPPPPEARAEYRAQALAWLTAERNELAGEVLVKRAGAQTFAHNNTTFWLNDPAYAAVRHPLRLAALPPEEAKQWLALWDDIRRLRDATGVGAAPPPRRK